MPGVKGQKGHRTKTSFKKGETAPKKTKKRRGRGRPPKPKKPTLLHLIYSEIDAIIESGAPFRILRRVIKDGEKKDATRGEIELAARYATEIIDRRLPKEQSLGMPRTLIIKNYVPYPGGTQKSEVVIETGDISNPSD